MYLRGSRHNVYDTVYAGYGSGVLLQKQVTYIPNNLLFPIPMVYFSNTKKQSRT